VETTDPQPRGPTIDREWLVALPKAEVHVHLEGCIERDLVRRAARHQGLDIPIAPEDEVNDLGSLLRTLDASCGLIDAGDDLAEIAYGFARHAAGSGIRYADVIVNPAHWLAWRDRLDEFFAVLDSGLTAAEADGFAPVGVCPSIGRHQSGSEAVELVEWIIAHPSERLVALSIDGNEEAAGRSSSRFADAFERAAAAGLHRCVHAGESSGPEGVWDAIDVLGAERVDHGIRCVDEPALVAELRSRGVPLDICPTSNVRLGVVRSLRDHPVAALHDAGVRISINTDDPYLLGTDVPAELESVANEFGWGSGVLVEFAQTSIDASFAPGELKAALRKDLNAYVEQAP